MRRGGRIQRGPPGLSRRCLRRTGSGARRHAGGTDHPRTGRSIRGMRPQEQFRSQRHRQCHESREGTSARTDPAVSEGCPLQRRQRSGARHRLQVSSQFRESLCGAAVSAG